MERVFTTKEVSELLNISPSTLRTWSILLEKNNYSIQRNNRYRNYTEADVVLLKELKELLNNGHAIEYAIEIVLKTPETHQNDDISLTTAAIETSREQNIDITNVMEWIHSYVEEEKKFRSYIKQELDSIKEQIAATSFEIKLDLQKNHQETLVEIQNTPSRLQTYKKEKKRWWKFW